MLWESAKRSSSNILLTWHWSGSRTMASSSTLVQMMFSTRRLLPPSLTKPMTLSGSGLQPVGRGASHLCQLGGNEGLPGEASKWPWFGMTDLDKACFNAMRDCSRTVAGQTELRRAPERLTFFGEDVRAANFYMWKRTLASQLLKCLGSAGNVRCSKRDPLLMYDCLWEQSASVKR